LTDAIRRRPGHPGGNQHEPLLWVLALMFGLLSVAVVRRRWVWMCVEMWCGCGRRDKGSRRLSCGDRCSCRRSCSCCGYSSEGVVAWSLVGVDINRWREYRLVIDQRDCPLTTVNQAVMLTAKQHEIVKLSWSPA
jgi:hypothetical protein